MSNMNWSKKAPPLLLFLQYSPLNFHTHHHIRKHRCTPVYSFGIHMCLSCRNCYRNIFEAPKELLVLVDFHLILPLCLYTHDISSIHLLCLYTHASLLVSALLWPVCKDLILPMLDLCRCLQHTFPNT